MGNLYVIQLMGVLLTAAGWAALAASAYVYNSPLRRHEKLKMQNESRHMRPLPISPETVASTAFILIGVGILSWSRFELCAYLSYWLPGLFDSIKFWLAC